MTQTRPDAARAPRPVPRSGTSGFHLGRFLREVIAELTKVIWPTRKELITYTSVVIVFVAVIIAAVAGLDVGFAKLVLWAFS
ncbi:MAG: preprotein translocase subunit SecE [Mycobacteriales bacterium]